jgi:hypothetical protein
MTFCLGVAEAKLANNMVNQLAWEPSVGLSFDFRCLQDDLVRLCRHMAETLKQESNGSARLTQDEPGYRALLPAGVFSLAVIPFFTH